MRVGTKSAEQDTETARANRIKLDGEGYYHVIDRIAHREFLLRDERIKKRLLDLMRRAAEFSGVDVCTYVIMDNHLHLCGMVIGMRGLSPSIFFTLPCTI